jgi:hypothetical protein
MDAYRHFDVAGHIFLSSLSQFVEISHTAARSFSDNDDQMSADLELLIDIL